MRHERSFPVNQREMQKQALFSLSQTLRRLAHRLKREALKWEAEGNLNFYWQCRAESDRLWRDAKWHLGCIRKWSF